MYQIPDGFLTTTDVVGQLYARGIRASRDRVARFSDLLIPQESIKRNKSDHRLFLPQHVDLLEAGLRMQDTFGIGQQRIKEYLDNPRGIEEFRNQVTQVQACLRMLAQPQQEQELREAS